MIKDKVGESVEDRRLRIASDRQRKFQSHVRSLQIRADIRALRRATESRLFANEPNLAAIRNRAEQRASRHLKRCVINHRQAPAEPVVRAGEGRAPAEPQSAALAVLQTAL